MVGMVLTMLSMKVFKDTNHIVIQGWMRTKLGLKGVELIIYAIIYGFTQEGETAFYGSRKYMAEASGSALPTVDRAIISLIEKGYIKKLERVNDGVSHCHYMVVLNDDNTPYQNDNTHINNKDNNKDNKEKNKDKSLLKKSRYGFLFEEDKEAKFLKWCDENVPNLMENKKPLSYEQFINLQCDGFPKQTIVDKMLYMDAKAGFNKKYKNVYGVLRNWLMSDKDPNYTQKFKNKKEQNNDRTSK